MKSAALPLATPHRTNAARLSPVAGTAKPGFRVLVATRVDRRPVTANAAAIWHAASPMTFTSRLLTRTFRAAKTSQGTLRSASGHDFAEEYEVGHNKNGDTT